MTDTPTKTRTRAARKTTAKVAKTDVVEKDFATSAFGALGFSQGYFPSETGRPVSELSSLQLSAVYACVRGISEDLSRLPINLYRNLPTGGIRRILNHPIVNLLKRPCPWLTPMEMWAYVMTSLLLRGNAFVFIKREPAFGNPIGLIPLYPDRVGIYLNPVNGTVTYNVSHPAVGVGIECGVMDVLHIRNTSYDGIRGLSTIAVSQQGLGIAEGGQRFAARYYRQGYSMGGVLKTEKRIDSPEKRAQIGAEWTRNYAGTDVAHSVAVLEDGMDFMPLTVNARDAMLIESRAFSVQDISRIFRYPLHLLSSLDRATFSNIDSLQMAYYNQTLASYAKRIEEGLEMRLLRPYDEDDDLCLRYDFSEIIRADEATRFKNHASAILTGWKNVNEVRIAEGMEPVAGGDVYRSPANMLAEDVQTEPTNPRPGSVPAPADDDKAPRDDE